MKWLPEELLQDAEFRQWVLNPTQELNQHWTDRLATASEDQQQVVRQARLILLSLPSDENLPNREAEELWESILTRSQLPSNLRLMPVSQPIRAGGWYRIAALLTLISVASWLAWQYYSTREIKIQTIAGQIRQFTLPDGSQITLNSNSTLNYPANWSEQSHRQVWLEGEAYFRITKQRVHQQPVKFVVHSADVNIEVLGTQFNVKNRRGLVNVTLDEGQIQVSKRTSQPDQARMLMKPGDVVEFSGKHKTFRHQQVKEPERFSAWTQRVLIFDNTPLQEVAQTLDDTFGLKITFSDTSLANLPFTGNVPTNDPNAILETLSKAFDLEITRIDEHNVTIQSR